MCSLRVPGAAAHPPRLVFTIYNCLDVIILRSVSYGALEVAQCTGANQNGRLFPQSELPLHSAGWRCWA